MVHTDVQRSATNVSQQQVLAGEGRDARILRPAMLVGRLRLDVMFDESAR